MDTKKRKNCFVHSLKKKDNFISYIALFLHARKLRAVKIEFLIVLISKYIIPFKNPLNKLSFFSSKNEQSNFCVFWCQFRVEGAILEKKVTSMTPIKIKSYQLGTIFSPFCGVLWPKSL